SVPAVDSCSGNGGSSATHLGQQPGSRKVRVPNYRPPRPAERFPELSNRQPSEKSQLDDIALALADRRQSLEGVVQCDDLFAAGGRQHGRFVQGLDPPVAAAFLIAARAGVMDEDVRR